MALSFKIQPFTIATFIFFSLLLSLPHFTASGSPNDLSCLKVSPINFTNSAKEVITNLQKVISILSRFADPFGQSRLLNAVSDCLDLLDMSADQLDWIISATRNPTGKDKSTGNLSSDLRTWLSAVLVNTDTCIEGLQGTIVMGLVYADLDRVMSSVKNLLDEVIPIYDQLPTATSSDQFPSWMKDSDMKLLQANETTADAVVAADGSGNYSNVTDAVFAAPEFNMKRYVIFVKKGVYVENVEIKKKKWNIMIIGEGMDVTVISANRSYVGGSTPFHSATFAVNGRGFIAQDISFRNTAGPEMHQAVALRSDSDLSVFHRCGIFGYQDSLYPHSMRQFYRECTIAGTVDFIFGDGTAVFQNCQILARQGLPEQKNTVAAQGRIDPNQPTGFSFQFCSISAENDTVATYLGRPWKNFSRTVFMQSHMSNAIRPEGWLEMNGSFALDTLYYGEYNNSGPGSVVANRVKWSGYHVLNDSLDANKYTVAQFIEGDLWLPSIGVNYTTGL
ncbi:pectinesterase/pectinesterase inhibitor PPE8B [Lathyrus oleraceus]|uniref:Pectinesterase n=3 Tax=Pisum sativum TaxID=3888 RepID=A0A9D4X7T2_PEA|nr:pectinesterase/pectinesterase inhibitor PPE8B-like [Pisum sativum]KAI5415368.1 putative pectinesterase/pectinesterase inhibitor 32 [Pisum sativum]